VFCALIYLYQRPEFLMNMSLNKQIPIREQLNLGFRLEALNSSIIRSSSSATLRPRETTSDRSARRSTPRGTPTSTGLFCCAHT
jgi:hypothetical protein